VAGTPGTAASTRALVLADHVDRDSIQPGPGVVSDGVVAPPVAKSHQEHLGHHVGGCLLAKPARRIAVDARRVAVEDLRETLRDGHRSLDDGRVAGRGRTGQVPTAWLVHVVL
jgi:hypothetical protein